MSFSRYRRVKPGPPIGSPSDSGDVDLAEQRENKTWLQPVEQIVGTGEVGVALHGHPVPARTKDNCQAGPNP